MTKLLHIVASPRHEKSSSLRVAQAVLESLLKKEPGIQVDTLDLVDSHLPELTLKQVDGKYMLMGGKVLSGDYKKEWETIEALIHRFLAADYYLLSTPMWNFNIPYRLKQYIDLIVQPHYLFRYTATGQVEGLAKNKKMVIVCSRGGDYSQGATQAADFQEPYLKRIFNFVGITDIHFVTAEGMDMGKEKHDAGLAKALESVRHLF